jgi:hypothetical protein
MKAENKLADNNKNTSRIKRVACERKYHAGGESERMFKEAGIKLEFKYDGYQEY